MKYLVSFVWENKYKFNFLIRKKDRDVSSGRKI